MQVEFRNVEFAHGQHPVLRGVDLTIKDGSVAALVGRSGSGKTTLLKLVNRLLLPDRGTVLVGGRDTREWDAIELRRRTGYVIQESGLLPHFTVEQNVALVPRLERWPADRIRTRSEELLELVGLPPALFARRWPRELSGGQRQRVAVARALAADPPVLLMDEPFGALDAVTHADLRREFTRIQRDLHKTVVIVTHDIAEALALGDHVGVLHGGRLAAWETPAAIVRSVHPGVRPFIDALPASVHRH